MKVWLHRNRWGLILLPLALALAMVASSDRVRTYYLMTNPVQGSVAAPGETLEYSDVLIDADGSNPFDITLTLDGVAPVGTLWGGQESVVPDGVALVRADLTVAADQDAILRTCSMALVDSQGREFIYTSMPLGGGYQPTAPCVPEATPGPAPSLGAIGAGLSSDPAELDRPPSWTVSPVFTVPEDAEIVAVRIWWGLPRFAELQVTPS